MSDDLFEYDIDDAEFYDDNEEVVNSSIHSVSENTGIQYQNEIFNNTKLKNGIVIAVYEIDDENNRNKKFPEYDVLIVEQKATSTMEPVIYRNCISIDGFGGVADFFEYKLRPVKEVEDKPTTPLNTNFKGQFGSMVLLLCLDGASDKGIIVKSVPHPGRKTKLTKDAGLHLEGEYNGLNWKINKDGELTITFKSKTDDKGKPSDDQAGGTHVQIDKKGSVDVNTNLEGKEETYIRMDKENKDIGLKAGNKIGMTAVNNIAMKTDASIKGTAKSSIDFITEGAAKVSAKSSLDLEGKSIVNVKGGNVMISGQNGVIIEGQQTMINSPKVFVGSGGTPAVIVTTKFVGSGNHGAPVVSSAVGPFSSTVFIAP